MALKFYVILGNKAHVINSKSWKYIHLYACTHKYKSSLISKEHVISLVVIGMAKTKATQRRNQPTALVGQKPAYLQGQPVVSSSATPPVLAGSNSGEDIDSSMPLFSAFTSPHH